MEQILLAYGLPKETVRAKMIFYTNMKDKVRSRDGHTDFFDIVAGVLQWDTLDPYLFIIYIDYILQISIDLMKENGFSLKKKKNARSRRYSAEAFADADYADDLALLVTTLTQKPENSIERAAKGNGLNVNAYKTE